MGDEREKVEEFGKYPVDDKGDTTSNSTIKKSAAFNRMLIVGCSVCVVTAILVAAIAVPVSKNSVVCEDCDGQTTCQPTTTSNPGTTTTTPSSTTPSSTTPGSSTANPQKKRATRAATHYGTVMGHEVGMGTGNDWDNCMSYLGVRYAKPPGRWERPEELDTFTEEYHADQHKTQCYQDGGIFFLSGQVNTWSDYGEDCLYMDIYSPIDEANGPYPVLIFFHGGAYQAGGNLQYPGQTLVQKGIVAVVVNYRLGIFGFASSADGVLKGNYGLWDQRMAMVYVQKSIAAYGGDPTKVTIAGQSAGASSSGLHLISPETDGLFHQALLQSGNELAFWALNTPINKPETYLPQVANKLACTTADTQAMVDCLKGKTTQEIYDNRQFTCNFCLGFIPVIDGEFVPDHPFDMMERGEFHDLPVLVGANTGECNLYVMAEYPWTIPEAEGFNRTGFQVEIIELANWFSFIITEDTYGPNEAYGLFNWFYTPWDDKTNKTLNKEALGQMCTDGAWTAATAQMVKMRAETGTPIYQYTNGISPAPIIPRIPGWIQRGIPHEFEIPFIWGYPTVYFGSEELKNDSFYCHVPFVCWSEEDVAFTEFFQTLWTNFVKHGDPTPTPIQHPKMSEPVTWEAYDNTDYHYFYMDNEEAGTRQDFRLREATMYTDYILRLSRGRYANPDDVKFVPYPYSSSSSKSRKTDLQADANGVLKRPRRAANMPTDGGQRFAQALSGESMREVFTSPDGPAWDMIKEMVVPVVTNELARNNNYTLPEIIELVKLHYEALKGTTCIQTVAPFYMNLFEQNQEQIIELITELISDLIGDMTLPPIIPSLLPLDSKSNR